jgi:hypothetical protein
LDSGIQSLPAFGVEIARGDDDDRDATPQRLFLQSGDDLKAVHFWDHQIEQNHVWLVRSQQSQRLASITGLVYHPFIADEPFAH